MALVTTQFEPEEIDQAGRIVVVDGHSEWSNAVSLINGWRASHSGPLNTFRVNLRRRVKSRDLVAQRLKRLPSIISKLKRLQRIPLSQMQDIGGCRVVVSESDDAFNLAADFVGSKIRHELISHSNYIENPRKTGYRSLHLVYAYNSDRTTRWQGLRTEIQIRSRLQHQWATAVETVGTFIGDDLKSNVGDPTWLRFFALMATVIAQREKTPSVPNTPTSQGELVKEIRECDQRLRISERLAAFHRITHGFQLSINNPWVVLELNLKTRKVASREFKTNDWESANSWYLEKEVESRDNPREVVLVSAKSLSELRRAYPNFFLDLGGFRRVVRETLANP